MYLANKDKVRLLNEGKPLKAQYFAVFGEYPSSFNYVDFKSVDNYFKLIRDAIETKQKLVVEWNPFWDEYLI